MSARLLGFLAFRVIAVILLASAIEYAATLVVDLVAHGGMSAASVALWVTTAIVELAVAAILWRCAGSVGFGSARSRRGGETTAARALRILLIGVALGIWLSCFDQIVFNGVLLVQPNADVLQVLEGAFRSDMAPMTPWLFSASTISFVLLLHGGTLNRLLAYPRLESNDETKV